MNDNYVMKIIMVGDCEVGKSSLLAYLNEGNLGAHVYLQTIGVDFGIINLKSQCDRSIKCLVWDTAGHERFQSITRTYYKGACGVVLMFDVSSEESFTNISHWQRIVREECEPGTTLILVGNKIDKPRCIPYEEANAYAVKHNMSYIEMSLYSGIGCNDVIYTLVEQVMKNIVRPGIKHIGVTDKSKRSHTLLKSSEENHNCCVVS